MNSKDRCKYYLNEYNLDCPFEDNIKRYKKDLIANRNNDYTLYEILINWVPVEDWSEYDEQLVLNITTSGFSYNDVTCDFLNKILDSMTPLEKREFCVRITYFSQCGDWVPYEWVEKYFKVFNIEDDPDIYEFDRN